MTLPSFIQQMTRNAQHTKRVNSQPTLRRSTRRLMISCKGTMGSSDLSY